ncbi:MAG: N-6 DNA methylase, partial [Hyphomonadaceae bacterium]|nr:N-6 DNA methylase [Hyphomonadaceae bacterium]
ILVLKKCKQTDDVLFINAAGSYQKGKRQNVLLQDHIDDIIDTYRYRREKPRYSRCASLEEIAGNDFNLNIPRYVDTSVPEEEINVAAVQKDVVQIGAEMTGARQRMVRHLEQLDIETGGAR